MPIYEYQCDNCQIKFEAIRRMSESDMPLSCPSCGQSVTHKLVTTACAFSNGHAVSGSQSSCSGCGSGNCGNCGH